MIELIASFALAIAGIDFGPIEAMIFGALPLSVRPLNPLEDEDTTKELLEFARRRPYCQAMPDWWSAHNVTTKEVAQKIQELEELNKILPPATDIDRFPPNDFLYVQIVAANNYCNELIENCKFLLKEEQDFTEMLVEKIQRYKEAYHCLALANSMLDIMQKRQYLQDVREILGENFYQKGVLPILAP